MPIGLATLRIIKPGEEGLLAADRRCQPDCVLVRNLAGLSFFREHAPQLRWSAISRSNVANELTADLFAEQGLTRLVPSYDLNWEQLAAMLGRCDPRLFEVVIHQHMPMFHMEHCVFAAMLSTARTATIAAGRATATGSSCATASARRSRCWPTPAAATRCSTRCPQSAAEYVPRMLAAGPAPLPRRAAARKPQQAHELLDSYRRVLSGQETGRVVWRQLKVLNQLGVTRGTLAHT